MNLGSNANFRFWRFGHAAMSALCSLTGEKRTSRGQPNSVAIDPGCVKTRLRIPKPLSTNRD